jgi:lactate permease
MREQIRAWSPYIILFFLVLISSRLVPPVNRLLGQVVSEITLYSGPGGKPLVIPWLTTPGTLVLLGAILGGLWQGARPLAMLRIYGNTLHHLASSAAIVISIVCMAKVLSYSGMMQQLAESLAVVTGKGYPFLAPFVGALGSFVTGSDSSSNILFGDLQKQVALQLDLNPVWIAASNTSGACIGKLLSPQNIALAAVATGLAGQEGRILRAGCLYALPFLFSLGLIVFVL